MSMQMRRNTATYQRGYSRVSPSPLAFLLLLSVATGSARAADPVDTFQAPAGGEAALQASKDRSASSSDRVPGAVNGARTVQVSVLAGEGTTSTEIRDERFIFSSDADTQ